MAKLDKIRFARLVHMIGDRLNVRYMNDEFVHDLDTMIEFNIPECAVSRVDPSAVDRLMELMAQGTQKIEAIKQYRIMTGQGLKDSKDAVEKYWVSKD